MRSPTPRLAAHLDLLHPARALWKLRLGSVRLVELGARTSWTRRDLAGTAKTTCFPRLIPQHYFDYLRGGPAEPLAAVVRHNQMDLRGLAAIMGRIDALLAAANRADESVDSLDLFGLSRFLQRRGDSDRAHAACSQALDLGPPAEYRPQARRELALLAKRRGDHERCRRPLARTGSRDDRQSTGRAIHACEQLAIYYERRMKDLRARWSSPVLALAEA